MRIVLATVAAAVTAVAVMVAGCSALPSSADPASDAPEERISHGGRFTQSASYADTLKLWRSAEDVNAWISERFEYDPVRATQLSETQRQERGRLPIIAPEAFFAEPRGVCVDLSRFAIETLRAIAPETNPVYVMIEFDPVSIAGNTLRRHWIASFSGDGKRYYFADSKRPGHLAGPYASTQEFVADYAAYRGRRIVSFRELDSYERKARTMAPRQPRAERP